MAKVKARVAGHRKVYIHNTLENAAFFLKNTIERKIKEDDRASTAFPIMWQASDVGTSIPSVTC